MLVCIIGQQDCSMITTERCLTPKKSQMLELIKKLFDKWSCSHEWDKIEEIATYEAEYSSRPYKRTYLYCCKKCGKFKKIKIQ